jgi:perosamine synthetase
LPNRLAVFGGSPTVDPSRGRTWPLIGEDDREAVERVLDRGRMGGPTAPEALGLQREFAEYSGVRHCLATNSGTAALHLALIAAGVRPGDEVITSAFTFSASALAVLHALAVPVFADIDPITYTIDPGHVEALISERTRAIMPVHIHGMPADLHRLGSIAERHGVALIEDACQAHGAEFNGKRVGGFGLAGAFSLNYTKSLPGGEGGLLTTNSDEVLAIADSSRVFGEDMSAREEGLVRPYTSYRIGWNYRTQELPAAFARSQLTHLDDANARAIRNAGRLTEALTGFAGLVPPAVPGDRVSTFQKYRLRLDPVQLGLDVDARDFRDRVVMALRAEGVEAVLWHTQPVPAYPLFQEHRGYGGTDFPWTVPPASRHVDYDLGQYRETQRLLDGSILIGSEGKPLAAQDAGLIDDYVAAIVAVMSAAPELVDPNKLSDAAVERALGPGARTLGRALDVGRRS